MKGPASLRYITSLAVSRHFHIDTVQRVGGDALVNAVLDELVKHFRHTLDTSVLFGSHKLNETIHIDNNGTLQRVFERHVMGVEHYIAFSDTVYTIDPLSMSKLISDVSITERKSALSLFSELISVKVDYEGCLTVAKSWWGKQMKGVTPMIIRITNRLRIERETLPDLIEGRPLPRIWVEFLDKIRGFLSDLQPLMKIFVGWIMCRQLNLTTDQLRVDNFPLQRWESYVANIIISPFNYIYSLHTLLPLHHDRIFIYKQVTYYLYLSVLRAVDYYYGLEFLINHVITGGQLNCSIEFSFIWFIRKYYPSHRLSTWVQHLDTLGAYLTFYDVAEEPSDCTIKFADS